MNEIFVPVILGTAREGRHSEPVARWLYSLLQKYEGVSSQLCDVRDFVFQAKTYAPWMKTEHTKPWQKVCERANGFIIVSPEYNHSFPGELKLLLDQAEKEYRGKYVGVCSVSSGGFGGIRMIQALLPVFHTLELQPIKMTLNISQVQKVFENEMLQDTSYESKATKFLDTLVEQIFVSQKKSS